MTLPGTILDPWNNLGLDLRRPSYKPVEVTISLTVVMGTSLPLTSVERRLQSQAKGVKQLAKS